MTTDDWKETLRRLRSDKEALRRLTNELAEHHVSRFPGGAVAVSRMDPTNAKSWEDALDRAIVHLLPVRSL